MTPFEHASEFIQAILNVCVLIGLVIAGFRSLSTATQNALTRAIIRAEIAALATNVKTIEHQTNGLQQALVVATAKAARAQGQAEGISLIPDAAGIAAQVLKDAADKAASILDLAEKRALQVLDAAAKDAADKKLAKSPIRN